MNFPVFGSRWRHHSNRIYTVLGIANGGNTNINYPISVVYVGKNSNLWVKPLDNFLDTMKEIIN